MKKHSKWRLFWFWCEIIFGTAAIGGFIIILINFIGMWEGGIVRWHEPSQGFLIFELALTIFIIGFLLTLLIKDIIPKYKARKKEDDTN